VEAALGALGENVVDLCPVVDGEIHFFRSEDGLDSRVEPVDDVEAQVRGDDDDADLRAGVGLVCAQQRVERVRGLVLVKEVVHVV